MKTSNFFYILLLFFLCCSSCTKYPISLGQQTLVGKIIYVGMPSWDKNHPSPCALVLGLETSDGDYIIIFNSKGTLDYFLVDKDIVCLVGDEVEITGEVTIRQTVSREVKIVDVQTIRKINEQNTYIGTICMMNNPYCFPFCPTEEKYVFGLEMIGDDYYYLSLVLSLNSNSLTDKLIVEGVEYSVGNNVEITGSLKTNFNNDSKQQYVVLEIETIKKN